MRRLIHPILAEIERNKWKYILKDGSILHGHKRGGDKVYSITIMYDGEGSTFSCCEVDSKNNFDVKTDVSVFFNTYANRGPRVKAVLESNEWLEALEDLKRFDVIYSSLRS